ncbi:hypothetical protein KP005_14050 [Geomonas nitrogeniifigens]|uniref:Uncharacterized protein n=1 Tax=Geomonas diazotrophica TaxID=2843197 RepID=A0ABX8JDL1_9BACT|nr:hypothetical protein [Geomonas nitrogeniifigens]QWV96488.1 hypothetical protein KP005_14050 [Geomonas nitrogeniifigens]
MKNTRNLTIAVGLAILATSLAACTLPGQTSRPATKPVSAKAPSLLRGKVLDTMNAAGYTYVNLETEGKTLWVAAPLMSVSIGQQIELLPGAELKNFNSKALNRTFNSIIFSGGMVATATGAPHAADLEASKEVGNPVMEGKVLQTMNAGAYTYILLEKEGRRTWSAIPGTEVKVGENIELIPGIDMVNFKSTTLNRNFPYIHFSGGLKKEADQQKSAAPPAVPAAAVPEAPRAEQR